MCDCPIGVRRGHLRGSVSTSAGFGVDYLRGSASTGDFGRSGAEYDCSCTSAQRQSFLIIAGFASTFLVHRCSRRRQVLRGLSRASGWSRGLHRIFDLMFISEKIDR